MCTCSGGHEGDDLANLKLLGWWRWCGPPSGCLLAMAKKAGGQTGGSLCWSRKVRQGDGCILPLVGGGDLGEHFPKVRALRQKLGLQLGLWGNLPGKWVGHMLPNRFLTSVGLCVFNRQRIGSTGAFLLVAVLWPPGAWSSPVGIPLVLWLVEEHTWPPLDCSGTLGG